MTGLVHIWHVNCYLHLRSLRCMNEYIRKGEKMNVILGAVVIIGVMSFAMTVFRDIGISMIFNLDAFLIVVGGTVIALSVGFPFKRVRNTVYDIINAYTNKRDRDAVIKDILEISKMYRRTDIRTLEKKMESLDDNFLALGVKLLINDYEDREIRDIMEREAMLRIVNSNFSRNLLKTIARLTPSFGLAGTVISLIKMFKHLESVDAIAPMMAVALMSTFYGVIIANLIMLPFCAKLREEAIESEAIMNITVEGILAINKLEHPLKIEERIRGCRSGEHNLLRQTGHMMTDPVVSGT